MIYFVRISVKSSPPSYEVGWADALGRTEAHM